MKRKKKPNEFEIMNTNFDYCINPCNSCGEKPKFLYWHKTGEVTFTCACSSKKLDSSVIQGEEIIRYIDHHNLCVMNDKWLLPARLKRRFNVMQYFLVDSVAHRISQCFSSYEDALKAAYLANHRSRRYSVYKMENDTLIPIDIDIDCDGNHSRNIE